VKEFEKKYICIHKELEKETLDKSKTKILKSKSARMELVPEFSKYFIDICRNRQLTIANECCAFFQDSPVIGYC